MLGTNQYRLQFVVQQIGVGQFSAYRVVIYGDQQRPRHSDFQCAQDLLQRLREAIPDVEWSGISVDPMGEGQGSSIVFDRELELDTGQLKLLGL